MIAEIIAIGDEILIGQVQDTNSNFLATGLTKLGFQVQRISAISDNHDAIYTMLDEVTQRCDLAIFTGGLGPTNDDITKKTFAEYFQSEMVLDKTVLKNIKEFFQGRGLPLTRLNEEQALVPDNCEVLFNHHGTAPGMLFRYDDTYVVSFPGVPFEMKPLFENELVPVLKSDFELPARVYKTFHLAGIPESMMADKLVYFEADLPAFASLAYLPRPGVLRLRLGVSTSNKEDAERNLKKLSEKLYPYIEPYLFGEDGAELEDIIGAYFTENNITLSTAESCTGGTIAKLITSVPGSSAYFMGSVVAYSNTIKENVLNVPGTLLVEYGAVSREVVESMSQNARKVFNTDYSVATSGIAGPTGRSDEKPVGTVWISVSGKDKTVSKKYNFGGHRGRNIERSSIAALDLLRKFIKNNI